jgi:uncharacterized protein (DUF1697 family)
MSYNSSMKYVALLRGINVGGNNIIKMADLKLCLEKAGLKNVVTYIQSGNVIFESSENVDKLEDKLEKILSKEFNYKSVLTIRSHSQIKKVLKDAPADWEKRADIRCYLAFVKKPTTSKDVAKEINPKENIDFIEISNGVVYMTTLISALTKSRLNQMPSKSFYKNITIRNYNTVQKIAALMEK